MKSTRRGARWFPPDEFYTDALCTRCGVCCGSTDGHPCEHLLRNPDGTYVCAIYEQRLGPHRTVDGHSFICVAIRTVIQHTGGYAECGYVREIKRIRETLGQGVADLGQRQAP